MTKIVVDPGICGCGAVDTDTDTDSDGTPDCIDADCDNDGMDNIWEERYGFNPLVDDASDDADNDGYSNLQECQSGTVPTNSNSKPIDFNGDGIMGLDDFIMVLQVLIGMDQTLNVSPETDINGDGKIGIEEANFILQHVARVRFE